MAYEAIIFHNRYIIPLFYPKMLFTERRGVSIARHFQIICLNESEKNHS